MKSFFLGFEKQAKKAETPSTGLQDAAIGVGSAMAGGGAVHSGKNLLSARKSKKKYLKGARTLDSIRDYKIRAGEKNFADRMKAQSDFAKKPPRTMRTFEKGRDEIRKKYDDAGSRIDKKFNKRLEKGTSSVYKNKRKWLKGKSRAALGSKIGLTGLVLAGLGYADKE